MTAEETRIAFWKNCVTQLKKENALLLLEYGDVHNVTTPGNIGELMPGGFTFVEANAAEGRRRYIDYAHVDSIEVLGITIAAAPLKAKAAGKG